MEIYKPKKNKKKGCAQKLYTISKLWFNKRIPPFMELILIKKSFEIHIEYFWQTKET